MSADEPRGELRTTTDAEIVARISRGDRGAEAEFVRKYAPGVRVLVRRHCRPNDPVAEDLAQDVLTRVLERIREGAINDGAALPAYVRTTVVYTTTAEYRARRQTEPATVLDTVAAESDPEDTVSTDELTRLLNVLLAQLPVARDREILVRFYLKEEDKEDVCRQLGIETSHFHRVVFRARERFRELLNQAGLGSL